MRNTVRLKLTSSVAVSLAFFSICFSSIASAQTANGNRIEFPNNDYWLVRNSSGAEICQGSGNDLNAGSVAGCASLDAGTYTAQNLTAQSAAVSVSISVGGTDPGVPVANGNRIEFPNNDYWLVRNASGAEICQGPGNDLSAGNVAGCASLAAGTYTAQNLTAQLAAVAVTINGGGEGTDPGVPVANGNRIEFPNNDYWLVRNPNGDEICQGSGNDLNAGNVAGCATLTGGTYTAENLSDSSVGIATVAIAVTTVPDTEAPTIAYTNPVNGTSAGSVTFSGSAQDDSGIRLVRALLLGSDIENQRYNFSAGEFTQSTVYAETVKTVDLINESATGADWSFTIDGLAAGNYRLRTKIWDTLNNSSAWFSHDVTITQSSVPPVANNDRIQFPNNDYWLVRNSSGSEVCQGSGNDLNAGNVAGCASLPGGTYTTENLSDSSAGIITIVIAVTTVPDTEAPTITYTSPEDGTGAGSVTFSGNAQDASGIRLVRALVLGRDIGNQRYNFTAGEFTDSTVYRDTVKTVDLTNESATGADWSFTIDGLAAGNYRLRTKVWDTLNNSSAWFSHDVTIAQSSVPPVANNDRIQFPNNDYWLVRNSSGSEVCQGSGDDLNAGNVADCASLPGGTYTTENLSDSSAGITTIVIAVTTVSDTEAPTITYTSPEDGTGAGSVTFSGNAQDASGIRLVRALVLGRDIGNQRYNFTAGEFTDSTVYRDTVKTVDLTNESTTGADWSFTIDGLAAGNYRLRTKLWDTLNNSSAWFTRDVTIVESAEPPIANGNRIEFPNNDYWLVRNSGNTEICQGSGNDLNAGSVDGCAALSAGTYIAFNLTAQSGGIEVTIGNVEMQIVAIEDDTIPNGVYLEWSGPPDVMVERRAAGSEIETVGSASGNRFADLTPTTNVEYQYAVTSSAGLRSSFSRTVTPRNAPEAGYARSRSTEYPYSAYTVTEIRQTQGANNVELAWLGPNVSHFTLLRLDGACAQSDWTGLDGLHGCNTVTVQFGPNNLGGTQVPVDAATNLYSYTYTALDIPSGTYRFVVGHNLNESTPSFGLTAGPITLNDEVDGSSIVRRNDNSVFSYMQDVPVEQLPFRFTTAGNDSYGDSGTISESDENVVLLEPGNGNTNFYDNKLMQPFVIHSEGAAGDNNFTTGSHGSGDFRIQCQWSHFAYDDPIVNNATSGDREIGPNKSHLHMFWGNTDIDWETNISFPDLDSYFINRGGSTCNGLALNKSSYWMPALMHNNDTAVAPKEIIVYYKARAVSNPGQGQSNARTDIVDMPQGLQLISGWGDREGVDVSDFGNDTTSFTDRLSDRNLNKRHALYGGISREVVGTGDDTWTFSNHIHWDCGQNGYHFKKFNRIPTEDEWETYCGDTFVDDDGDTRETFLASVIYFPQCRRENGELSSANARDHVIHTEVWNGCPENYVRMPQLGYLVYWDMTEFRNNGSLSMDNLRLSSDPTFEEDVQEGTFTEAQANAQIHDNKTVVPIGDQVYDYVLNDDGDQQVRGGTLHADWLAGWNTHVMNMWIKNCSQDSVNCSTGQTGTMLSLINKPDRFFEGNALIPVPDGSMRGM